MTGSAMQVLMSNTWEGERRRGLFRLAADEPRMPQVGAPGGVETAPAPEETAEEKKSHGEGWAVILYNDDKHSMIEVALVIVAATGFDLETAWAIMMRAHQNGKSTVIIGEKTEAERVASVLRTAKLTVEIKAV